MSSKQTKSRNISAMWSSDSPLVVGNNYFNVSFKCVVQRHNNNCELFMGARVRTPRSAFRLPLGKQRSLKWLITCSQASIKSKRPVQHLKPSIHLYPKISGWEIVKGSAFYFKRPVVKVLVSNFLYNQKKHVFSCCLNFYLLYNFTCILFRCQMT